MATRVLLNFNTYDHHKADMLIKQERINPSNKDELFKAMIYSVLSSSETYPNQMKMYNALIKENSLTAGGIIKNGIDHIVRDEAKNNNIRKLSMWWNESGDGLYSQINEDLSNGKEKEFDIRNDMVKNVSGLSYKCSSLVLNMCGYRNVVVLDLWAMRALVSDPEYRGEIKSYYYRPTNAEKRTGVVHLGENLFGESHSIPENNNGKKSNGNNKRRAKHTPLGHGLYLDHGVTSKSDYLKYESLFNKMAKKYNLTPFDFKQLIWVKNSTWGKTHKPMQMSIDYILSH